jgi:hypothetical protein
VGICWIYRSSRVFKIPIRKTNNHLTGINYHSIFKKTPGLNHSNNGMLNFCGKIMKFQVILISHQNVWS